MIRISVIVAALLSVLAVQSQERYDEKNTLLKGSKISGGFVGTTLKVGELNNQDAIWLGGETGVIFGQDLGIGFAGYGMINSVKSTRETTEGNSLYFQSGYGGFLIEPAMFENRVFSISFPSVIGAGGIAETTTRGLIDEVEFYDLDEDEILAGDVFWVLEPGAQLNLNVTRWMKINAGVSYRKAFGLDFPTSGESMLDGMQGTVSVRLGWF